MEHKDFEQLVEDAYEGIPQRIRKKLDNVGIVIEDEHRRARSTERRVVSHGILLGLYQGVPLTRRGMGYSGVLPDKITIFKDAIEYITDGDPERIRKEVKEVVWHEVGHHLGMDEAEVRAWEKKRGRKR